MPRFGDYNQERKQGTYRARFVRLDTDFPIVDKQSGEDVIRWRWVFQDVSDPTTVGELDTITSPHFKSRSNGLKFLTGMLGRAPVEADDPDTLVGQEFDVVWGPNQTGRLTIVNVMRPQTVPTPVAAGLPAVDQTPPGELPF